MIVSRETLVRPVLCGMSYTCSTLRAVTDGHMLEYRMQIEAKLGNRKQTMRQMWRHEDSAVKAAAKPRDSQ